MNGHAEENTTTIQPGSDEEVVRQSSGLEVKTWRYFSTAGESGGLPPLFIFIRRWQSGRPSDD
jgi:hypothetical protein